MPAFISPISPLSARARPAPTTKSRRGAPRRSPPCCQFSKPPKRGSLRRPDAHARYPAAIPQTIEYALRQAQVAVAAALVDGVTRLVVELPMGRSRRHWYRMSPVDMWMEESSRALAFHFAELFRTLDIRVVLGHGPGPPNRVPWITDVMRLEDVASAANFAPIVDDAGESVYPVDSTTVVIVAAVSAKQREALASAVECIPEDAVVIMLNCMLDAPFAPSLLPAAFAPVYVCRAFEKCAVLRNGHQACWDVFVEIAVFEYEWTGEEGADWVPTQTALECSVSARGASRKGVSAYYETPYASCEAGFWPFMTIACPEVLPLDGRILSENAEKQKSKTRKSNGKPFGFF